MNKQLEEELKKALKYINADWKMQNNFGDYRSNFIYYVDNVDEVIRSARNRGISTEYALHRWYNFHTSIYCEQLFCELGAVKEQDTKNREIDIYIKDEPFDVKVSVYPKALSSHPYDLNTREGKDEMIRWLYQHQSQQQRKHLKNRLFIVCDGKTQYDNLCLKSDFEQIRKKIEEYMDDVEINGFNELTIIDNGKEYKVKSDIIYIN